MSAKIMHRPVAALAVILLASCGEGPFRRDTGGPAGVTPDTGDAVSVPGSDPGKWEDPASLGTGGVEPRLTAGELGIHLTFPFSAEGGCTLTRAYCWAEGPWPNDIADDGTNICTHRPNGTYDDSYALDFANGYEDVLVVAAADGAVAAVTDQGTRGYGLHVLVEHGDGIVSLYGHLRRVDVTVGQHVRQGQALGLLGSTGNSSGPHVHFSLMRRRPSDGGYVGIVPEPMSGYSDLHLHGYVVYGKDAAYPNLPVGTVIRARDRPEIYLVCGDMEKCHIADWDAFATRRFFHDARDPTAQIVNVPGLVLDCYRNGPAIAGSSVRALIRCGGVDHLYINEGGVARKRRIPFGPETDRYAYDVLLRSWGFSRDEWRDGSYSECHSASGDDLRLRDGTLIELASDDDFYVVTADVYEHEGTASSGHGYVRRIMREEHGEPFMPLLYRTYNNVLMVQDDAIYTMTAGALHGKNVFDALMAAECRYGTISVGGSSGTGTEASAPSADEDCVLGARRCDGPETYAYCAEDGSGGTAWSVWPCPSGWVCGDGGQCASTEDAPDIDTGPAEDPPHAIRCTATPTGLEVRVTGPVLDALIATPVDPVALQYGSDTDGWVVPYGAAEKPSVPWGGDGDHAIVLPPDADRFNLYVADGASASRDSWFDLDESMDGVVPWSVVGDCRRDGTVIVRAPSGQQDPETDVPSDGTPTAAVSHTVVCERGPDALTVTITGPVLDALHGGTVTAPTSLQYGSNTPYLWVLPYDGSSGRAIAPWEGDDATYVLTLPPETDGINIFVADDAGGGRWFDLDETDGNGVPWSVGGDCERDGTLIRNAGR